VFGLGSTGTVTRDELMEVIRSHRRRWPIARVLNDPPGFRAELEQLLQGLPADEVFPPAGWIDETWLDRLFDDPIQATDETRRRREARG
jgi:hypothetical protein